MKTTFFARTATRIVNQKINLCATQGVHSIIRWVKSQKQQMTNACIKFFSITCYTLNLTLRIESSQSPRTKASHRQVDYTIHTIEPNLIFIAIFQIQIMLLTSVPKCMYMNARMSLIKPVTEQV